MNGPFPTPSSRLIVAMQVERSPHGSLTVGEDVLMERTASGSVRHWRPANIDVAEGIEVVEQHALRPRRLFSDGDEDMTSENRQDLFGTLTKVELELDNMLNRGEKAIKVHLLHQYNDVKDAAQIVINYIANVEGTTVTEVHKRLNLSE